MTAHADSESGPPRSSLMRSATLPPAMYSIAIARRVDPGSSQQPRYLVTNGAGALHQVRDLALDVFHLVLRLLQVHELDRDDIVGELIARGVDVARAAAADPRTEFEPLARQRHPKDNFSLEAGYQNSPELLILIIRA